MKAAVKKTKSKKPHAHAMRASKRRPTISEPREVAAQLQAWSESIRTRRPVLVEVKKQSKKGQADKKLRFKIVSSDELQRKLDEWGPSKSITYKGLAQKPVTFSLEVCYNVPEIPVPFILSPRGHKAVNAQDRRNRNFAHAIAESCGEAILTGKTGREKLISGMNNFFLMTESPDYPVKTADIEIVKQHMSSSIGPVLDKANVVELGIGDGHKTMLMLFNTMRHSHPVSHYYTNDIVVPTLKRTTSKIKRATFGSVKVSPCPGDFFNPRFWKKDVWKTLRQSPDPTVIILQGATFNNFGYEKMDQLLKAAAETCKPGTSILLSIDSTSDVNTLSRAYNTPASQQFLLKGFVHSMRDIGVNVDPHALSCKIHVDDSHPDHVAIKLVIKNKWNQKFRIPAPKIPGDKRPLGPAVKYTLKKGEIHFEEIHKLREEKIRDVFKAAGCEVVDIMKYKADHPKFRDVNMAFWHVRTPTAALALKAA